MTFYLFCVSDKAVPTHVSIMGLYCQWIIIKCNSNIESSPTESEAHSSWATERLDSFIAKLRANLSDFLKSFIGVAERTHS